MAALSHKAGLDYDIIVFAWQQTPAAFQGAQQTWLSTSGSNYGAYKNAAGRHAAQRGRG